MRYSRLKRRRTRQRYAAIFIILSLIVGIVCIASANTIGKYISDKIAPILNSFDKEDKGGNEGPKLSVPNNDDDNNEKKITETIKANPLVITAIQTGAFNDSNNAHNEASELKKSGAAGYIVESEHYRVLAMGYQDEEDAKKVKEQLKEDDIETVLYPISTSGASMEITATEENVDIIKQAFSNWEEKFSSLENTILEFDSKKLEPEEALSIIDEYKTEFSTIKTRLDKITENQEDNSVLIGLVDLYDGGLQRIDKILSVDSTNLVELSSEMKYTYIDMIYLYDEFMNSILGS